MIICLCRALFSFSPDSPKELRLQAGQLVRSFINPSSYISIWVLLHCAILFTFLWSNCIAKISERQVRVTGRVDNNWSRGEVSCICNNAFVQSVATHIVRFHPKPVSCKTVFLQLLIQNPLLFRWTEGKAFSPPLTLLSCQSAKGARLCHCFLFIVISSMPKLIVCQCCSQNWFQVLVRHSFRSSRLAELSVVKGEVRKTFSMLTLPLQSAQSAQCVWT